MLDKLLSEIKKNNYKSISKAISLVENNDFNLINKISSCSPFDKKPHRIGITGPPGAGKSSITNLLIKKYRKDNLKVSVLLVDPSSSFSKGAVLGDRIRMLSYFDDDNVFIRSFGSRGNKGGLSDNINEIADIFSLASYDIIIFETVGVGQIEIDVVEQVDSVVLTLVPESGDEVQLMKAGIIEIADMFIVNKSDRPGSKRISRLLSDVLHSSMREGSSEPAVMNATASIGDGMLEIFKKLLLEIDGLDDNGILEKRRLDRYRGRVKSLIIQRLEYDFWIEDRKKLFNNITKNIESIDIPPSSIVEKLLSDLDR